MKNAIDAEIQTRRRNGAWQTEINMSRKWEKKKENKAKRKKRRVTKSVGREQKNFNSTM